MADAADSKSVGRKAVKVRLLSPAFRSPQLEIIYSFGEKVRRRTKSLCANMRCLLGSLR